jgi:hypothetical protein
MPPSPLDNRSSVERNQFKELMTLSYSLLQVCGEPTLIESGDGEVVHLEHFHVAVAKDADAGQRHVLMLDARLPQELRRAIVIGRVIGSLARRDQDRNAGEARYLMNDGTTLQPAALLLAFGGGIKTRWGSAGPLTGGL